MDINKQLVDRQIILDLLYGDEEYVKEFAAASIESFSEFQKNFEESLIARDMENLRKVGHKIKPVSQMMKLDNIITMYETSKILLEEDAPDSDITDLINKMNTFCNRLLKELKEMA